MTVNELIKALQALPEDVRELPAVLWTAQSNSVDVRQVYKSSTGYLFKVDEPVDSSFVDCVIIS